MEIQNQLIKALEDILENCSFSLKDHVESRRQNGEKININDFRAAGKAALAKAHGEATNA